MGKHFGTDVKVWEWANVYGSEKYLGDKFSFTRSDDDVESFGVLIHFLEWKVVLLRQLSVHTWASLCM